ncbi:protease [Streptomyces sp. NPDC021356]|uniref:protease n=1 Tax=Streptomyces sp. NPDC021356 TaxID=3154900 RepID=UPI0034114191
MTKFLLAVHVLAAIVAVGPVTVAASMFPPAARRALSSPGDPRAVETVRLLLRICRVYAVVGVVVPVFGFATARNMGVLGDTWLIVSIALTALAALVLAAFVLPRQAALAEGLTADSLTARNLTAVSLPAGSRTGATGEGTDERAGAGTGGGTSGGAGANTARATARLAMFTGLFNLLWAAVTVLMIVRPGSTTGA